MSPLPGAVLGSLGHWLHAVSSGAARGAERRQLGMWKQKLSVQTQEAWMVKRKRCKVFMTPDTDKTPVPLGGCRADTFYCYSGEFFKC